MIMKHTKTIITLALSVTFLIDPASASATDKAVDILPAVTHATSGQEIISDATHDALRLTPDRSEIVTLDEAANSIIIGNPAHINIIADSAKRLVIVPRAPGATHFTILGKGGKVLMQRHAIVASPKKDYINIKRTCTTDDCVNASVFYCPDMCHEIQTNSGVDAQQNADAAANEPSDKATTDSETGSNASPVNDTETLIDER